MKDTTAVAIAAAVEKKLGQFVNLRSNADVWEWTVDSERVYAVLKNTESPAMGVAQNVYNFLNKPAPPKPKRKDIDDE